ncbi:nuclease SbcCD subunit C-like [Leptidea sinapis]|uniref:nuclease SbcCD subunit C-like n=1 Tax=Leptidea sinapis TaxID=189913 RepID=UPI0021C3BD49|nr:nuclease SbcCD subunit C-like [Leptidea sinapis]
MNFEATNANCLICVCSVEGKDEFCSKRPAKNVNECIRMATIHEDMQKNILFTHKKSFPFRIRRDYIWHKDEIPLPSKAKCLRGSSYYSNSYNVNDTDIDLPSDVESILDYQEKDICFFCVCALDGKATDCISREPWFCEYYRILRDPAEMRNRYTQLFQQDRPAYFRHFSYRLRRTMDAAINELIDGMKWFKRIFIFMLVGEEEESENSCIPFVSQYSDCSEANACSGCNRCTCNGDGKWACKEVIQCPSDGEFGEPGDDIVVDNLEVLYSEVLEKAKKRGLELVPPPPPRTEDVLLGYLIAHECTIFLFSNNKPTCRTQVSLVATLLIDYKKLIFVFVLGSSKFSKDFEKYVASREKRSLDANNVLKVANSTVKFHNAVDEINKDTLKNNNNSGTIEAAKVNNLKRPILSRRTALVDNINKSDLNSLHIELNQNQDYDHHIAENKIDSPSHIDDKLNSLHSYYSNDVVKNHSESSKDEELSKLIVNELKKGTEIIGDTKITPMSNITFTSENDTITAMAFIAGNLLNRLWTMEKDSTDASFETDSLKHEKINDLLSLFKEPLSIRQENFLKNALEKLSVTLSENKNRNNVSICETYQVNSGDMKHDPKSSNGTTDFETIYKNCNISKGKESNTENKMSDNIPSEIHLRLNNVLNLINKYESIGQTISSLKEQTNITNKEFSEDEKNSVNLFAKVLEKITKLLVPRKRSKKILKNMRNLNQFASNLSLPNNKKLNSLIGLAKLSVTEKDKIIQDYITHIQSNPNCLLSRIAKDFEFQPDVQGDTMDKLSEFLKISSSKDLRKFVEQENKESDSSENYESTLSTFSSTQLTTESTTIVSQLKDINNADNIEKFKSAKEKLKAHLKNIIDDILELQNEGKSQQNRANLHDLLPCLSNMLNKDNNTQVKNRLTPLENIKKLIDTMKLEFRSSGTRRSNSPIMRTASSRVWERVIKNINDLRRIPTRRLGAIEPSIKSFEDLRLILKNVEASSNSYKNFALLSNVPPHKRLMLLKTLEADVKQHRYILEAIKSSFNAIEQFSAENRKEVEEFIENTRTNTDISNRVLLSLRNNADLMIMKSDAELLKKPYYPKRSERLSSGLLPDAARYSTHNTHSENIKVKKEQVVNQLMINRIQLYLKLKEDEGTDLASDINYKMGKRAVFLLRNGNSSLGKQLYELLIPNNIIEEQRNSRSSRRNGINLNKPFIYNLQEPLLNINNHSRRIQPRTQDQLFKQLANLSKFNYDTI